MDRDWRNLPVHCGLNGRGRRRRRRDLDGNPRRSFIFGCNDLPTASQKTENVVAGYRLEAGIHGRSWPLARLQDLEWTRRVFLESESADERSALPKNVSKSAEGCQPGRLPKTRARERPRFASFKGHLDIIATAIAVLSPDPDRVLSRLNWMPDGGVERQVEDPHAVQEETPTPTSPQSAKDARAPAKNLQGTERLVMICCRHSRRIWHTDPAFGGSVIGQSGICMISK